MAGIDEDAFAREMDIQNPSWFVTLANEQELKGFVYNAIHRFGDTDGRKLTRLAQAEGALRQVAARRLFTCARASWCGLKRLEMIKEEQ